MFASHAEPQFEERQVYISKQQVVEFMLILLIWYAVRVLMLLVKMPLIHIPVIDESVAAVLNFVNNIDNVQQSLELTWMRLKYKFFQ